MRRRPRHRWDRSSAPRRPSSAPAELLVAIAQTETGLYSVPGLSGDAFEGQPAYGVMAARRATAEGRCAAGYPRRAGADPAPRQRACSRGAAPCSGAEAGLTSLSASGELAAWAPAVARFSGLLSPAAQYDYVESGVYQVLRRGLPDEIARRHGLSLAPQSGLPDGVLPAPPGEAPPGGTTRARRGSRPPTRTSPTAAAPPSSFW